MQDHDLSESTVTPSPRPTRVAAALEQLAVLDDLALVDHPDLYQQIHGELQGVLAELDND